MTDDIDALLADPARARLEKSDPVLLQLRKKEAKEMKDPHLEVRGFPWKGHLGQLECQQHPDRRCASLQSA